MVKLSLDKLPLLLDTLAARQTVYLPVDQESGAKFEVYSSGKTLSSALNTVRSAKDFFFPQTETLVDFKVKGKSITIIDPRKEHDDFILFGVRACDVKSFEILDRVFLQDPVDTYYQNRRKHCTVISLACNKPAETCFCQTFGIDAADPLGDVVCHMTQDTLYLNAKTDKGRALLTTLNDIVVDSDEEAVEKQKDIIHSRFSKLPLASLKSDAFGADKTDAFFNAPAWEELSKTCLGCGSCTFVCPTCQCYDIKDFNTGHGVKRFRCWDSCMYSDFTRMAHGNPRLTQKERFRQRFMHKLVYYPTNHNGLFSCVGCGRCLVRCPINMNIVKVMKTLGGGDCE